MTRFTLPLLIVCLIGADTFVSAETPNWTFTEEQLRLFTPPMDADAESMLEWCRMLESPIPKDTELYGGFDKYREHVQLMRIMICRAILATDPPFDLEEDAWWNLWYPYVVFCEQNQGEWLPKMKAVYDELTGLSRKKGETLDQQTTLYLHVRAAFFISILGMDKEFLPHGEKLLGEIDKFMKNHREFDCLMEELYAAKSRTLQAAITADEKYMQIQADFKAEQKALILQNEDRLQSPIWFHLLYPEEPYDTPEKQAAAYRLIDKFQKLIDTNETTKRFDSDGVQLIYNDQIMLFLSLIYADKANIAKLQTYLDALEKKNDPQLRGILYSGYRNIWSSKLHDFSENGGSDDDLAMIFDAMMKCLEAGADNYDNAGSWLRNTLYYSPMPFEQCTPEQRTLFMNRWEEVLAKMETLEKPWKEAGKRMDFESYVEPLRNYIGFLRLPGTVVLIAGQTVEGKPFDLIQYRGKVVVLHFWATWCGPCIKKIPLMKELYTKYHDQGFEVLGISYDDDLDKVQEFIEKHKLPYLSLFDKDRAILNRFSHGQSAIHCLIDREGKAVFYMNDKELQEKLKELFDDPNTAAQ